MVTACGCSSYGSTNTSCSSNGICSCKSNFDGNQCNICNLGFYDYPNCYCKTSTYVLCYYIFLLIISNFQPVTVTVMDLFIHHVVQLENAIVNPM